MKVAIVGTRNPSVSYEQWTQVLKDMNLPTVAELVSGGAKGIDSYTKRLSKESGIPLIEFNERDQREMVDIARIGFIEDLGFEVFVRTDDEESVPHVHIWDYDTRGEKVNSCVKLLIPEYLTHRDKCNNVFNPRQKEAFTNFMSEVKTSLIKRVPAMTNYEFSCWMWGDNNSNMDVDVQYDENDNPIIPDYSKL